MKNEREPGASNPTSVLTDCVLPITPLSHEPGIPLDRPGKNVHIISKVKVFLARDWACFFSDLIHKPQCLRGGEEQVEDVSIRIRHGHHDVGFVPLASETFLAVHIDVAALVYQDFRKFLLFHELLDYSRLGFVEIGGNAPHV